jgi:hypothetical protein
MPEARPAAGARGNIFRLATGAVLRIRERRELRGHAAEGERVVLSGGRHLAGAAGEANGRWAWVVQIPEVKEGRRLFRQLFTHSGREPGFPSKGLSYRIAARLHGRLPQKSHQAIRLRSGKHRADLA